MPPADSRAPSWVIPCLSDAPYWFQSSLLEPVVQCQSWVTPMFPSEASEISFRGYFHVAAITRNMKDGLMWYSMAVLICRLRRHALGSTSIFIYSPPKKDRVHNVNAIERIDLCAVNPQEERHWSWCGNGDLKDQYPTKCILIQQSKVLPILLTMMILIMHDGLWWN